MLILAARFADDYIHVFSLAATVCPLRSCIHCSLLLVWLHSCTLTRQHNITQHSILGRPDINIVIHCWFRRGCKSGAAEVLRQYCRLSQALYGDRRCRRGCFSHHCHYCRHLCEVPLRQAPHVVCLALASWCPPLVISHIIRAHVVLVVPLRGFLLLLLCIAQFCLLGTAKLVTLHYTGADFTSLL